MWTLSAHLLANGLLPTSHTPSIMTIVHVCYFLNLILDRINNNCTTIQTIIIMSMKGDDHKHIEADLRDDYIPLNDKT